MRRTVLFLVLTLATVVALSLSFSVAASAADPYPNGCLDCHKKTADKDLSLPTMVKAAYAKHIPVKADADVNFCLKCHKPDGKLALQKILHDVHNKSKVFTGDYKGTCTSCHVAGSDGKMTTKVKGVK